MMRFATIDINTNSKQLDLSISNLPGPDGTSEDSWDAYVVQNVDRWRKQVGLEASTEKWAGATPIKLTASDIEGMWIDVEGTPGDSGDDMAGRAPFMSGAPMATPPRSQTPQPSSALNFETPEGWTPGAAGGMREAAFTVGDGDEKAEITVITAGGDLRSNVARWMRQVSGEQPPEESVDAMLEGAQKFDVDGRPAQRFVIAGDPEKGQDSIDATIVPIDETRSKFIKMTGAPSTVAEHDESMKSFLGSLSF